MKTLSLIVFGALVGGAWVDSAEGEVRFPLRWEKLPSIPSEEGFSGHFAGVSGNALVLAGGTNFPGLRPWEGGAKKWYGDVFVLESGGSRWFQVGKLPTALGYGVSVSDGVGLICVGGGDDSVHSQAVFRLEWKRAILKRTDLPALPSACAFHCGALVGTRICVLGGIENPNSREAIRTFRVLDLQKLHEGWKELEPLPGPARILAVAGSFDGDFYVFGGADFRQGSGEKPERVPLRDAYRYGFGVGWRRLKDLPKSLLAAPSPAVVREDAKLCILGGDEGNQSGVPLQEHRGFSKSVLTYDTVSDGWSVGAETPFGLVTTTTLNWKNGVVVPGGEIRPGIRSTEVWRGSTRGER